MTGSSIELIVRLRGYVARAVLTTSAISQRTSSPYLSCLSHRYCQSVELLTVSLELMIISRVRSLTDNNHMGVTGTNFRMLFYIEPVASLTQKGYCVMASEVIVLLAKGSMKLSVLHKEEDSQGSRTSVSGPWASTGPRQIQGQCPLATLLPQATWEQIMAVQTSCRATRDKLQPKKESLKSKDCADEKCPCMDGDQCGYCVFCGEPYSDAARRVQYVSPLPPPQGSASYQSCANQDEHLRNEA
ncbi:hypothetical protein DNTS_012173, partial [Danionella cerebrum]